MKNSGRGQGTQIRSCPAADLLRRMCTQTHLRSHPAENHTPCFRIWLDTVRSIDLSKPAIAREFRTQRKHPTPASSGLQRPRWIEGGASSWELAPFGHRQPFTHVGQVASRSDNAGEYREASSRGSIVYAKGINCGHGKQNPRVCRTVGSRIRTCGDDRHRRERVRLGTPRSILATDSSGAYHHDAPDAQLVPPARLFPRWAP